MEKKEILMECNDMIGQAYDQLCSYMESSAMDIETESSVGNELVIEAYNDLAEIQSFLDGEMVCNGIMDCRLNEKYKLDLFKMEVLLTATKKVLEPMLHEIGNGMQGGEQTLVDWIDAKAEKRMNSGMGEISQDIEFFEQQMKEA